VPLPDLGEDVLCGMVLGRIELGKLIEELL
jgi:hypothetical protein